MLQFSALLPRSQILASDNAGPSEFRSRPREACNRTCGGDRHLRVRAMLRSRGQMNRNGLIVLLVAVVAGGTLALVLDACGSGSSGSHSAASPACLPATVDHSAKLEGLSVDVSPAPGTVTANPHTQISFLGAPATAIHGVSVTGQRSGPHAGHLYGYSQGDGASFVPDTPFDPGERVVVQATIGGGRRGSKPERASPGPADLRRPAQAASVSPSAFASTPPTRRRRSRSSPARRRRPPTTRASTPCRACRPRS